MQANEPLDFLQLFFTDEIIDNIVTESNLFYRQQGKVIENWKDISREEMKAFLGIILAMGIIDLPKFHDYWSKTGICNSNDDMYRHKI